MCFPNTQNKDSINTQDLDICLSSNKMKHTERKKSFIKTPNPLQNISPNSITFQHFQNYLE